jgi:prepilin-type N-terminal cleavage/methylation domain-containing protein
MRRVDNRGFTLIEVLIALTVLGVTMVAVFAGFSSGLKLRAVTRDRVAFDRDSRLMINSLRDDFANLVSAGPGPMVSADAIVLWRLNPITFEGSQLSGPPLLVPRYFEIACSHRTGLCKKETGDIK